MKHKIWNIKKYTSTFFTILLLLTFILHGLAINVDPDTQFIVGNETYTVFQTMDFHTIIIEPSYIIFNTTGFYVTSGSDITITLVHLHNDIAGAVNGDKVLEFYADTTGGTVWFNLSGFPVDNNYVINRGGSTIAIPTANASGYISFNNSLWSEHLFTIFQGTEGEVNNPPVVSGIPDQTISGGASFAQINLDDYVSDVEDLDEDINWSYSGNIDLLVNIFNRVATISTPIFSWYGVEMITFTAEDTGGLSGSDDATFIVTQPRAPVFSGLSISNGATGVSVSTSSLSVIIEEPEGGSFNWTITTSPNIGSNSGNNNYNGTKSCSIFGLVDSKTYYWFVNATDGTYWTNASYFFTTVASSSYYLPKEIEEKQNNPPETPKKPSGPTFIESGVEYLFETSTFDVDEDKIRIKFDWGDGNISEWSEFFPSNSSISDSYFWNKVTNFSVRAIAQDEKGLNSSWSPNLNIMVSQVKNETTPVLNIKLIYDTTTNDTITFDASESFDPDEIIVSYHWDFGDGNFGVGKTYIHKYQNPGEYIVILTVTDNSGYNYSKIKSITVFGAGNVITEQGSDESKIGLPFLLMSVIIGIFIFVIIVITIVFRKNIKEFVSSRHTHSLSDILDRHDQWKIKRINYKINKINKKIDGLSVPRKLVRINMESSIDESTPRYTSTVISQDTELTDKEDRYNIDNYNYYTGEKIDKLLSDLLKSDSFLDKRINRTKEGDDDEDINLKVDRLLISKMLENYSTDSVDDLEKNRF